MMGNLPSRCPNYMRGSGRPQSEYAEAQRGSCVVQADEDWRTVLEAAEVLMFVLVFTLALEIDLPKVLTL